MQTFFSLKIVIKVEHFSIFSQVKNTKDALSSSKLLLLFSCKKWPKKLLMFLIYFICSSKKSISSFRALDKWRSQNFWKVGGYFINSSNFETSIQKSQGEVEKICSEQMFRTSAYTKPKWVIIGKPKTSLITKKPTSWFSLITQNTTWYQDTY